MSTMLRLVGGALLFASGVLHLDLYLTGYRTIPTIGWLFLLQAIGGFALAIAVVVFDHRIIAAAGAGLFISTLAGYLAALRFGLFGFREVRTTAGIVAGVIELVGFAVLSACALRPDARFGRDTPAIATRRVVEWHSPLRVGRWTAGLLAMLAALSFGLSLGNADVASTTGNGRTVTLKVADVKGVSVLTNARGFTLYWFAPDSPTKSHCYGTCAAYWPPVTGTASAPGVAGTFTTLKRSDGASQVTYNGHPLYTYVGDSTPGQASGNHVDLNGGYWYEMKASK